MVIVQVSRLILRDVLQQVINLIYHRILDE